MRPREIKLLLAAFAVAGTDAFVPSQYTSRSLVSVPRTGANLVQTSKYVAGIRQATVSAAAATATGAITETEVRNLFGRWNDALATLNSSKVAGLYASDGVLLPTVSDTPRTDYHSIKDYFDKFLELKPQGVILDGKIKIGEGWAQDAGIYEFTLGKDGSKVKARYSFVYVYQNGEWKIAHHHSSQMPEEITKKLETPTEEEARSLFYKWNDALATLDPGTVADRYAKTPLLLPTVSDTPRTTYYTIKEYFVEFLKLKPQGVILDSHVTVGNGWCQDAGIYEFTMGANGNKVKARYSFVYLFEDGEWKISHHHSSQMPEEMAAKINAAAPPAPKEEPKKKKGFLKRIFGSKSEDGPQTISKGEAKKLFYLWNDALATLDSDKVAARYAKKGVLLPTVSDTPRTDYSSIKDYFDNFLKLKPQGVILDSYVMTGDNWCKDVGIYEFTMGANGNKVKARYSFVYVYEDGEWKIAHHHSSQMPEEVGPKGKVISESEAQALFGLWNDALATLDPDTVAKRYSSDPILLPTVSDEPRSNYDSIKNYFVGFLQKKPQGKILNSFVTTGPNWATDAGIYEFTMGATGDVVKARYSFVYVYEDGEWKIKHHHSSTMPESNTPSKKASLSEKEVKDLFYLWNDALATLDPDTVAKRYASNSVLLPTVSDDPRVDYAGKKDYFTNFLKNKPQGVILESYATSGDGWCKDVGIYEFTMGANGSKVKARYSFVYVLEDGEWKISHHHSSMMPEEVASKSAPISKDEVEGLFKAALEKVYK